MLIPDLLILHRLVVLFLGGVMKQKPSLRQLAKELGVSASYLSQVMNGKRPPSDKLLSNANVKRLLTVKQSVKHSFG